MQLAVVGCGWLGLPLAKRLQKSGHTIVATCRTEQKAYELTQLGFKAHKFELGDTLTSSLLTQLFAAKVLILNIPVGRKNPKTENFVLHMQALLKHAAASHVQNLIFISTTSVYADDSEIVTEQSPTQPQTKSGQINLAVEGLVDQYFKDRSTIIRPAGLVGSDRHPARYLAGKKALTNPNNVVNLVHQQDVISAIQRIIDHNLWGYVLHLSADAHPTRAEYYTWAAKRLGLPEPDFVGHSGMATGKKIDAKRSLEILQLSLSYPSPFDMLGKRNT